MPATFVGVIIPKVVKAELPEVYVTVGKPVPLNGGAEPDSEEAGEAKAVPGGGIITPGDGELLPPGAGAPLPLGPPVVGTTTITPLYGAPITLPAESVGVISPVVVNAELPVVEVTVGKPVPDAEAAGETNAVPGGGTSTPGGGVLLPLAAFVGTKTITPV